MSRTWRSCRSRERAAGAGSHPALAATRRNSACTHIPARVFRRGLDRCWHSGGPHAGFASEIMVSWVAQPAHGPNFAGCCPHPTGGCRCLAAPARTRPAGQGVVRVRHESRGQSPQDPPQARPAVPTLIPSDDGLRRRGQVRWLAWPAPKDRLPAEHAGLRLLPVPAARYDEAGRPSSRLDHSVCDPSGGGSAMMMARVRKVGMKRRVFSAKGLEYLGVRLVFVHVLVRFDPSFRHPRACHVDLLDSRVSRWTGCTGATVCRPSPQGRG